MVTFLTSQLFVGDSCILVIGTLRESGKVKECINWSSLIGVFLLDIKENDWRGCEENFGIIKVKLKKLIPEVLKRCKNYQK